jgi:enoyl-CoA hydratase/carnithine racemase
MAINGTSSTPISSSAAFTLLAPVPRTVGPLAVQATRDTLNGDLFASFRAATEREAFVQMMLRETNDFKEGVKAGFDRRDPVFTGS